MGKNWYGLGLVLLVLSLIAVAFLSYENHTSYGLLGAIWGLACFVMGLRGEMKK